MSKATGRSESDAAGTSDGPWLALDTATPLGSVAIGWPGRILAEVTLGVQVRHSEALLPAISFVLERTSIRQQELSRIIVGAGPGSFTGVRIAAATGKGLARALGLPLFAYSSLAALAANAAVAGEPVCALFDARRNEVYAACYRFPPNGGITTELAPAAMEIDDVLRRVLVLDPVFVGEGAIRHRERIAALGGRLALPAMVVPHSSALIWLAGEAPELGQVSDPAHWVPDYARPAGAERTRV